MFKLRSITLHLCKQEGSDHWTVLFNIAHFLILDVYSLNSKIWFPKLVTQPSSLSSIHSIHLLSLPLPFLHTHPLRIQSVLSHPSLWLYVWGFVLPAFLPFETFTCLLFHSVPFNLSCSLSVSFCPSCPLPSLHVFILPEHWIVTSSARLLSSIHCKKRLSFSRLQPRCHLPI